LGISDCGLFRVNITDGRLEGLSNIRPTKRLLTRMSNYVGYLQ